MSNQNYVSRLWILGASDPEMAAIETLLKDEGKQVVYAKAGGNRVHPGNAYKAETLSEYPADSIDEVVLVECGFTEPNQVFGLVFGQTDGHGKVTVVDHHRPGDPGYGKSPQEFLAASSLGQVNHILDERYGEDPRKYLNEKDVLIAAADHCLEAAYRGKCPGVSPEALMQWRAESRAAFQKRPVKEVLLDIERAVFLLRQASGRTRPCCGMGWDSYYCPQCGGSQIHRESEFADLRGQQIPELPEAAAREGIAFLSIVKDKDGREKVVLQAAPAELVQKFLAGELVKDLTDYYGDPARGFAGGYIKSN